METGVFGRLMLSEDVGGGNLMVLSYRLEGGGPMDNEEGKEPPSNLGPPLLEEVAGGSL